MQRYFCSEKRNNQFILSSDDSYHIKKVMRMTLGDCVEVIYEEKLYIAKIIDIEDLVEVEIVEVRNDNNEMTPKLIIVQSLVNEQKMDLILQKCTELGVYSFYPYQSLNSVVKDNGKGSKKVLRWQRIVKEASEQSKRNIIPVVHEIIDLKTLCEVEASLKLICTVNEMTRSVKKVLQEHPIYDTIIIVIGPEGGFKDKEEQLLIDSGFIPVSLGSRVLRTETAPIAIASMLNYEWMV